MQHAPSRNSEIAPPRKPQFGLSGLLMLMFILSMVAAGAFYFVQAMNGGRNWKLTFILFTAIAPVLIGIAASLVRHFVYTRLAISPPKRDGVHPLAR